ncbi:isoprenoid biosynthesis glyoxalase ElbB [Pseudidiomarina insulisalsae]|uniref:Glyoxalase n=1 Tax=Pseudidiomarina insulisalsae TaxID=575789 RepID=A0A432YI62_9GAMM|nr:isoprenoid biosynthesis glyoxalase ElbB [Pseudidiomarina insulisalsae]RUO60634.1 isoprenoid biosynthesis protein ElbB [Pseudidiomarina insulisalsae]
MKKVAVLLSGAGFNDGAEINEAVLTLLHIGKQGATYQCFAPDVEQMDVVNHVSGETTQEKRNVMTEAARIARGDIKPLNELNVKEFDALILPGGYGVAKNFCDFAVNGADMTVNEQLLEILKEFAQERKPAGYICISPVLLPYVYGEGVHATIGNDKETANAIEKMGGTHVECPVDDIVLDDANLVVTTPAYMLAKSVADADKGIGKLVEKVLYMAA